MSLYTVVPPATRGPCHTTDMSCCDAPEMLLSTMVSSATRVSWHYSWHVMLWQHLKCHYTQECLQQEGGYVTQLTCHVVTHLKCHYPQWCLQQQGCHDVTADMSWPATDMSLYTKGASISKCQDTQLMCHSAQWCLQVKGGHDSQLMCHDMSLYTVVPPATRMSQHQRVSS